MQLNNPFQMNDWGIKKFLGVILAIQLALWGVIGLDVVSVEIPILREFVGFVYLTFIPGIIILRILKLHKLGNIETLLYTVGLSIATLMFTELLMNTVYPLFGISGPISIMPLIITISVVVLIFCVICYVRDKDFSDPSFIDVGAVSSPPALFLCLIPFLAIFGTYMVNFHHNNILLLFLIIIIALIVVLIGFNKFIPKNLYPLAVFVIAISLLYHRSLISVYLWGSDIFTEHYVSNLVIINSYWNPTTPGMVTAMLSIVMLAPAYSNICDMSITWVFKIIYPLLFSLVPLGLYRVFQKQTNEKIAFLSCFFFVSLMTFYDDMLSLARQQIAELFLVLLILLMIDKNMNKIKSSFLFIVFGVSLVVSHYGLSYIYMLSLIAAWLLLVLAENPEIQKLKDKFYSKFSRYKNKEFISNPHSSNTEDRTISSTFILLFIVFTLAWYMYVSSSSTLNAIVHIGDHIATSIFTEILNPEAAEGLDMIVRETVSPLHSVTKYLHLIAQFFIAVGVLTLLLKRNEMKFEKEYVAFSVVNFALCLAGIAIPYFASALNTVRLYQITLIFLAPFCVIGGTTVFKVISSTIRTSWTNKSARSSLKGLSVFFVILLLFNTGFVYELADDYPASISLSSDKVLAFRRIIHEQDMTGAEWLVVHGKNSTTVYADDYTRSDALLWSYGFIPHSQIRIIRKEHEKIEKHSYQMKRFLNSYIFLSYVNVVLNIISFYREETEIPCSFHNTRFFNLTYSHKNKIYDNGCNIYI